MENHHDYVVAMENREVVEALKRGFEENEEKYTEALAKLGILHWAEDDEWWK